MASLTGYKLKTNISRRDAIWQLQIDKLKIWHSTSNTHHTTRISSNNLHSIKYSYQLSSYSNSSRSQ